MSDQSKRKQWYLAGMMGTTICIVVFCLLDNLPYLDSEDSVGTGTAIALLLFSLCMLIVGVLWSRVGQRSHIVGFAISGLILPILVGGLLSLFGLSPKGHGYGMIGLMFDELLSLITAVSMVVGSYLPRKISESDLRSKNA